MALTRSVSGAGVLWAVSDLIGACPYPERAEEQPSNKTIFSSSRIGLIWAV